MRESVEKFIHHCATCQKIRLIRQELSRSLGSVQVSEPGERLAIDFLGPFPPDDWYIHVMIDMFDNFLEMTDEPDATARSAAHSLLTVAGRYGMAKDILSDMGPAYISEVIKHLVVFLEAGHKFTVPHRPQANPSERTNQEVLRHLRAICFDFRCKETLRQDLPLVQRIINSAVVRRLGTAPMRIRFGDSITLDRGLINVWKQRDTVESVETYVDQLTQRVENIIAASQRFQSQELARHMSATPADPASLEVGSYVLVSYPPNSRPPDKVTPRWRGPMVIMSRQGSNTYDCLDLLSQEIIPFDLERLKLYNPDPHCDPVEVAMSDRHEFLVEEIVDHVGTGKQRRGLYFRVRWANYGPEADTWMVHREAMHLAALTPYLIAHPEVGIRP